ncbi:MAG: type II toxin-antitoxin system death-on-curing family toxin [Mollicutes bacterium]|nr:MAG: type II toxin-antitoxin system death-on-curing family toxin [Mollicutes bacterium]
MKITKIDKQLPRILITKGDSTDNLISFLSTVFVKNIESKIELNTKKITFDEKMVESIIEIINVSIKEIKSKTNDEMVGIEKEKKIVEGMVVNFINKCSYEPISMIHFINQIFIRILKGHYFINGNKRIAIMTLRNVLF